RDSFAYGVPTHDTALCLRDQSLLGIAAPSANRSGTVISTTAAHVAESFGEAVYLVLDAGPAEHGIESTIVGLDGTAPVLLRPGALPRQQIEAVVGPLGAHAGDAIASHGPMRSHSAP